MKILNLDQFNERINIGKINIKDVDTSEMHIPDTTVRQPSATAQTDPDDWHGRTLKSCADVAYASYVKLHTNFKNSSYYGVDELSKLVNHVDTQRFSVWEHLNEHDKLEKHKQRAASNVLKEKKLIATMYCAFQNYGKSTTRTSDLIINFYIDRMRQEFGKTKAEIIDIFYEK